ncbi:MAG: hypothetical protein LBG98_02380 [Puniceicoccales bacterium]|jgi:general secretion pathway protein D|nr:hypothetical protein [Puniceicoccales bacterium]
MKAPALHFFLAAKAARPAEHPKVRIIHFLLRANKIVTKPLSKNRRAASPVIPSYFLENSSLKPKDFREDMVKKKCREWLLFGIVCCCHFHTLSHGETLGRFIQKISLSGTYSDSPLIHHKNPNPATSFPVNTRPSHILPSSENNIPDQAASSSWENSSQEWLALGYKFYTFGQIDRALLCFRHVLYLDENSADARAGERLCLAKRRQDDGAKYRKSQPKTSYLPSGKWPMIQNTSEKTSCQDMDEETAIIKRLQSIVLPEIEFQGASFGHAIEVLKEMAIRHDDPSLSPEKRGFNMVVLGNVPSTTLTLRLCGMSLERILRFVAKAVHYQFDIIDGAVVFFNPKEPSALETRFFPISRGTVVRIMGKVSDDPPMSSSSDTHPPTIVLEEAYLKNFFQRAGIDFHGTAGSDMVFDGTQLIVTHTPFNLRRLGTILCRYRETKQVEIETRFVEIQEGALDEFALQWGFKKGLTAGGNTWRFGSGSDRDGNFTTNIRTLTEAFATQRTSMGKGRIVPSAGNADGVSIDNSPPIFPHAANYGNNAVPLGDFVGVISGGKLNLMMKALEQNTGAEMICAPKITVLSGKMASITVAQELRYPARYSETKSDVGSSSINNSGAGVTITAGRPENFQTRKVGIEMSAIPTVEDNGHIDLRLNPVVTEFEGFVEYGGTSVAMNSSQTVYTPSGFYQPIFSIREIKTELTIQDGSTVVMGGLMHKEAKEVHDKVPILGDLPLLGKLFRSHGETTQKKNLLIFVTANILSADGMPLKDTNREMPAEASENSLLEPSMPEKRAIVPPTAKWKYRHRRGH